MTPRNDERCPGEGSEASSNAARHSKDDTSRRSNRPQVVGRGFPVVGTRGVPRTVILVEHCPFAGCNAGHVHTAAPGFVSGVRAASCRGGRYVVHIVEAGA